MNLNKLLSFRMQECLILQMIIENCLMSDLDITNFMTLTENNLNYYLRGEVIYFTQGFNELR
jgi:hypothetical protein